MQECLVVGNQTLTGPHLHEYVTELTAVAPTTFHIVVPATPPSAFERAWLHSERPVRYDGEAAGFALARSVLRTVLSRWTHAGLAATGEVGDPDPERAVHDALRGRSCDLIVVSTLPARRSRWLSRNLPHRLEAAHGLPVVHLPAAGPAGRTGHLRRGLPAR